MKIIPYLIIILVSLSGCFTTKKRCLRLYPPISSVDTVVNETVRDSLVIRDTTIFVDIPGEAIIDSVFIPVKVPVNYKPDTLIVKTAFAESKSWIEGNHLKILLIQSGNLQVKLDSAIRESYLWHNMFQEINNREVVKVKFIPLIYKIALGAIIGQFIMIILFFLARRLKLF